MTGKGLADAPAFVKAPGGAAANVAVGLVRLGASSAFIGKVGDDPFGHFPWATAFQPRLTTMAQPGYAIGQEAVSLPFDRISGARHGPAIRKVLKATVA